MRGFSANSCKLNQRFLQHALPKAFMRIQHYGYLANACRKKMLLLICQALGLRQQQKEIRIEPILFDGFPCTICKQGQMVIQAVFLPLRLEGG